MYHTIRQGVQSAWRQGGHGLSMAAICALGAGVLPGMGVAETSPQRIETAETFHSLVFDRALTRFGVLLEVGKDGSITGRVMGAPVTGTWEWRDGYFCRDFKGTGRLGYDCQTVELRADSLRFRADRGAGETLDLRLR
jgi:hypothetical protein